MNKTKETAKPDLIWPSDITDVPTEVFVRPDIFEAELETIFYGPYWQVVAHEAEIPNPGDFKTFDLGRVPLLIARGDDGAVRTFINACSHRQNQVETAPCGNSKGFECPYHRWTFKNDGSLNGAPGCEDFSPKFKKESYGLKQVRMESVFGLILVCLADNPPSIEEYLTPQGLENLKNQIGHAAGLKLLGYQKVRYACNWKVIMDNDGYHAPLLHTGFRLLGWQSGNGQQFYTPFCSGVASELKPGKTIGVLKDPSLIEFKSSTWNSYVTGVFPATIAVKHLDIMSVRFAIPRAVDCTEIHYAYFGKTDDSEEMTKHRVRQTNLLGPCGMISMEDAAAFARIQIASEARGMAIMQKGVKDLKKIPTEFLQNDESPNIPRWHDYRAIMGFRTAGERQ